MAQLLPRGSLSLLYHKALPPRETSLGTNRATRRSLPWREQQLRVGPTTFLDNLEGNEETGISGADISRR